MGYINFTSQLLSPFFSILFNFLFFVIHIFFVINVVAPRVIFLLCCVFDESNVHTKIVWFFILFPSNFFHCCQCSKSYISFMYVVLMNQMFTQRNSFFVSPIIFFLHLFFNFFPMTYFILPYAFFYYYSSLWFDDTIYTFLFSLLLCLNLWMIQR